ncbi:MAG: fused MFS/spermidine synthase [Verrucomicrobia bacterium]|nr:fused MFS/spermidine synthase [Verrucomicrobiota bacterium]
MTPPATNGSDAPSPRATRVLLGLICFVAGAAIMVIEISANRLLAPNFGNSLHTWTALIGVILIAFSVGGFLGGALADKFKRMDLLGWLLAGAAALTMLIPALNILLAPSLVDAGLISGPVIISLVLFTLPGILLGAVSPAAVRLYSLAGHDEHVGRAAGFVSMMGSLGSFVGTFLCGFVLLALFGVKTIFLGTGAVLCALSLPAFQLGRKAAKNIAKASALVLAGAAFGGFAAPKPDPTTVFKHSSFYHQIEIQDYRGAGETNRYLMLDSTIEGAMTVGSGDLVMPYQRYWQLARLNGDLKLKRALFIGGGAFGMPEHTARLGRDVHVDVVEIDPAVIAAGRRFFKLDEFPNVHAHAGDARRFLRSTKQQYDLIFGDAYNGVRRVPSHLVTREFFSDAKSKLADDGVFLINIVSAVEGGRAALLGNVLATLRAVFSHVEVFAVNKDRQAPHNVILLASTKSWKPWLEDRSYAPDSWQGQLVAARVPPALQPPARGTFTDDWNPVDTVIAQSLLK